MAFRQLFLSKERYNLSKRILRSSFAGYERQTLYDLCAISALKISSYSWYKSLFLKNFPATAYEKQPSFRSGLLLLMFAEITFGPSINLKQPVIVLFLFLTSVAA